MNILEKMTMVALGICGFSSLLGCTDQAADTPAETDGATGEVGIALQLPSGTTILSASYSITGPKGFIRTGKDADGIKHDFKKRDSPSSATIATS